MSWRTISFDCYGTLVDWESGIVDAFQAAASREGATLNAAELMAAYHAIEPEVEAGPYRPYRQVLGETARRVAKRLGWDLPVERSGFLAESLPDWPVFEDTRAALDRLEGRYRLAILSNVDNDLLQATIERIGIAFDWTVTAEDTLSYKPAHGHFVEALRRVQNGWGALLHAAQSYFHDIAPAGELRIDAVWVNRKLEAPGPGPGPQHTVRNLKELADWLEDNTVQNL